ncbi:MAG: DNA-binding domain-containing protein [Gammaproteobacteria bacterium]|nr:DNA-binding domain-containing protein [Gammaproteobacteria bacterium]
MRTEWQNDFAAALRNPDATLPPGIRDGRGAPRARRFAVYRNNHFVSLIDALADAYPVVQRLVGDEFFRAMAKVFVATNAPRSPVMLEYGAGFAEFLDEFEPVAQLPYLADVARLEWAWLSSYHAADADGIDATSLTVLLPTQVDVLQLQFHPAAQLVCSRWPILSIWEANVVDEGDGQIKPDAGPESVLLNRPRESVDVRRLPPGGGAFIQQLMNGLNLAAAAALATKARSDFDLPGNLQGLLESGAVIGFSVPGNGATRENCDTGV